MCLWRVNLFLVLVLLEKQTRLAEFVQLLVTHYICVVDSASHPTQPVPFTNQRTAIQAKARELTNNKQIRGINLAND